MVDIVMPELKNQIILYSSGVKYQCIFLTPYFKASVSREVAPDGGSAGVGMRHVPTLVDLS